MNSNPFQLVTFKDVVWCLYLVAALALPIHHIQPIRRYLHGSNGIGDACMRTEAIQCLWRLPALLFSIVVAPSLPLFLSIFLDLLGRVGRVIAMRASHRRWLREHASINQATSSLEPTGTQRKAGLHTTSLNAGQTRGRRELGGTASQASCNVHSLGTLADVPRTADHVLLQP